MTQILRESARKMVSSLSFKTFKMKFQKKAVRHNDCQVLLYHSQRVDHTQYYAVCGWLILKFERKLHRDEVGWASDPQGAASQPRDITIDIHMVTWGESMIQDLVFARG